MKRTLTLKSETIGDLTAVELSAVVGAAIPTSPVRECYDDLVDTLQATRCFCP